MPSSPDELDAERAVARDDGGLFGATEVVGGHVGYVGPRVRRSTCPYECGCAAAYCLTEAGARRSELPSRSTGFTALP